MIPIMSQDPTDTRRSPASPGHLPTGWLDAIYLLLASRIGLIQIELREAVRDQSRSLLLLILAVACLGFAWALLLIGGIAVLAALTMISWPILALSAAAVHLMVALLLVFASKGPKPTPFPITRSEFQKDREWIASLQSPPTSKS